MNGWSGTRTGSRCKPSRRLPGRPSAWNTHYAFPRNLRQIPVLEHNGDFFPCDHFVDREHRLGNIRQTPLGALLESQAQREFGEAKRDGLPRYCRECETLAMCHGGCPKYRFIRTPDGDPVSTTSAPA